MNDLLQLKTINVFTNGCGEIECHVYEPNKRAWKTNVWFDEDTGKIEGGAIVEYSPDPDTFFEAATWIPDEVNTAIEKCVARAKRSIRTLAKRRRVKVAKALTRSKQMNQIEVTVAGMPASGKSAVARAIEVALTGLGATVRREDYNELGATDEKPGVIEDTVWARMAVLANHGLNVTVRTKALAVEG
jgi:hypothetical protein